MGSKSDFAQKLLHDLRLRKERMSASQNLDAYGNSMQILKGSRGTKTSETIGTKIGSRYKSSGISKKSLATVQATNQVVPYGSNHHSRQTRDFSIALAYGFDGGGKLKSVDFTSNGAMMGFLQQIGRRSMQQNCNMQWGATNQFPTLTHLHIDEIAKGAQKLNQILRSCSNDLIIDKGSIEIGKELLKGAMELEQSLKMLASLQEASDCMAIPQRKSRLKLLEDEDSNDDQESPISTEKEKQVERPVFSFDKASKNSKGSFQIGTQQKLMSLTYLKEAPNSKPEKHSARCCPEFQSSQHTNSSKMKHDKGKIPNVIAKLMGLEELAQNVNTKVATERQTISKQRSGEVVSTKAYRSHGSAEVKIEYAKHAKVQGIQNGVQSNKISIVKSHQPEPQKETYRVTYNYSYRTTADHPKPKCDEGDREAIRNHLKESQESILKINELQSKITQLNEYDTNQKDIRKETRVTSQKRQEVKDDKETLSNWKTQETEMRAANKPPLQQQKQKREFQLQQQQVLSGYETRGKKIESEVRSQQRANKKSEPRKTEGKTKKLNNSQNVATAVNKLLKQPPIKQTISAKRKNEKTNSLPTSKALEGSDQNEVPVSDGSCISSDTKHKSSVSLKPEQISSSTGVSKLQKTQACVSLHMDAKSAHVSAKKVINEIKPPKISSMEKTNEVMTRTMKTSTQTARELKTQKSILQKRVDKISASGASQGNDSMSKSTKMIPKNAEPSTQASQQQENAEQIATTINPIRNELHGREVVVSLPPSDKGLDTKASAVSVDQHDQQIVSDEVQEAKPPRTTTDGYKDSRDISYDRQPMQPKPTTIGKQDPLTEDEMFLKQKVIKSNLFLNTAEALFKLNIPVSVLNYANDQICQEKDSKLILGGGYELLKRKGRKREIFFYHNINMITSHTMFRSLDDLVRQLHKDFETLRSYGRNGRDEYDDAGFVLKMLERDIHYSDPDLNCMWDLGWKETMFAYVEMDEVISNVERILLEELVDEIANDCMLSSNYIA